MGTVKKVTLFIGLLFLVFLLYNFSAVNYGIQQGIGQFKVIWGAKPIEELMIDPTVDDSIKQQFVFIEEIKQFAEKSLGLKPTQNYSTYYDQNGKPILWVVTASPEFKIEAKEWCFPVAGCFPYKGFFDLKKAKKEEQKWIDKGWDTELDEVNAWSTLGWLNDPILSSMLNRSKGRLAELIIHESLHATLYVKDSVQFNENLASFIGRKGAKQFLIETYGDSSTALEEYLRGEERKKIFKDYMRSAIEDLNHHYTSLDDELDLTEKKKKKQQWINELKLGLLETAYFENREKGIKKLDRFKLNNAYFSGFSTYSKELPILEKQLQKEFDGNLKAMIDFFEKKYESL